MINYESLLINVKFGIFKNPCESRFESFFSSIKSSKKIGFKKNKTTVVLSQISEGKDKRTSFVIKNIPLYITQDKILNVIESLGNINFFKTQRTFYSNTYNVYFNLVNYKSIIPIFMYLKNQKFGLSQKENEKEIELFYTKQQGKIDLKNYFNKIY